MSACEVNTGYFHTAVWGLGFKGSEHSCIDDVFYTTILTELMDNNISEANPCVTL